MTESEKLYVQSVVESEGFFYGVSFYTDFQNEVQDAKFHELRNEMLKAAKALGDYVRVDISS